MTDSVQRWGIIGLGAQADGIAKALQKVDGVELAGCMTSTPERVAEYAATFGCEGHRSEEEFFAAGYDLVVVAGKNAAHNDHCVAALQGGSAVLCEKPLTLTRADAEKILATAEAHGLPLYTGYHYRFRALSREIRDFVAAGAIGEVRDVHLQRTSEHRTESVREWRHDLALAGAGVMCDVGVHLVDFVGFVTGKRVLSVGALADPPRSSGRPDEHIIVSLELSDGALGTIDAARALASADNSLQLHGSEGSIYTGPLRWVDEFHVEVRRGKEQVERLSRPANAPLLDEMVAVRDALRGEVSDLLATGDDGLRGAATLEAVITSLETGTRIAVGD